MNNAQNIIGEWRRVLNTYRAASRRLANEYIKLTSTGDDDMKLAVIEKFGKNYLKRHKIYTEIQKASFLRRNAMLMLPLLWLTIILLELIMKWER